MKPKILRLLCLCALLFGLAAALHAWLSPGLPRTRLADGRELRVLKISYGAGEEYEHDLGGASPSRWRAWKKLPPTIRKLLPVPASGIPGDSFGVRGNISVWVAILKPGEKYRPDSDTARHPLKVAHFDIEGQRADGEFNNNLVVARDNWNDDAFQTGIARQFLIVNPRLHLREFHLGVPVGPQIIPLTIANPHYVKP